MNRYVGVWYVSESDIIWVANREEPLKDSSGIVAISEDGNLVVINGKKEVVWSSNVSSLAFNASAKLVDTGNLLLLDDTTGKAIWESFQHPTDSYVPNMRLSTNKITGKKVQLTSWKNRSDPSVGNFSFSVERVNFPEMFLWNKTKPYFRSGPWNGRVFLGVSKAKPKYQYGTSCGMEEDETVYHTYSLPNGTSEFTMLVLSSQGTLVEKVWRNAYAYDAGIGCMSWSRNLVDIQRFNEGGADLYIKVAYSELGERRRMTAIIVVTTIVGMIIVATCSYFLWAWTFKHSAGRKYAEHHIPLAKHDKLEELPLYDFRKVAIATNNFHSANLLGKGGFGPVYKGELQDGQKIAVKRLSRASSQGLEEFMNEDMTNFCWNECVYSLSIRIFKEIEEEANTRKVVGTYGYMSPEYAMKGYYSEKSDVYSFGVLMLEIVSGRKNNNFYDIESSLSLIGFAWKLWNEGNVKPFIDPKISYTGFENQILRCIHIGLLCVQELAAERPSMTNVLSLLNSEIVNLPSPMQVAFVQRRTLLNLKSSLEVQGQNTNNNVSLTDIQGR
ncbi:hypothetical protein L6164_036519 [Bauhinia variegata]|uniref:Uncharacterized protein n=1 Tax=Bauhinia variegata TaxID=167791 RepID=A0ACB9KHG3_BAUVA|nr:hypothetical protein L6164_036519 [Bauhinia variegata]